MLLAVRDNRTFIYSQSTFPIASGVCFYFPIQQCSSEGSIILGVILPGISVWEKRNLALLLGRCLNLGVFQPRLPRSLQRNQRLMCMYVFVYTSDIKYCCVHCLSAHIRSQRTEREAQLTVVYHPSREPVQAAQTERLAGPAGLGLLGPAFFSPTPGLLLEKWQAETAECCQKHSEEQLHTYNHAFIHLLWTRLRRLHCTAETLVSVRMQRWRNTKTKVLAPCFKLLLVSVFVCWVHIHVCMTATRLLLTEAQL